MPRIKSDIIGEKNHLKHAYGQIEIEVYNNRTEKALLTRVGRAL
jgi:hypothetical protein